jgi:hypothetical protein
VPARLSGSVLNDAGFAKIRAGDYKGALPLLEQAVKRLRGTGSIVNAYALYNLAVARFEVGRCDGVLAMLDRSQARQGHRYEIDRLRAQARRRCKGPLAVRSAATFPGARRSPTRDRTGR